MSTTNGTQFIPKFMKILHIFQKLYIHSNRIHACTHTHTHTHTHTE